MRGISSVPFLTFGIVVSLCTNVAKAESIRDVLSKFDLNGALDGVPSVLELDLDAVVTEAKLDPRNSGELMIVTVERVWVRVDIKSKKCVSYLREHTDAESNSAEGEPVDASEATRIAVKLLADAGIEYAPDTLRTDSTGQSSASSRDLTHSHYTIRVTRTYQGYPARSGAIVIVDALGGGIRLFRDQPLVPPKSMVHSVTESEALEIALAKTASNNTSILGTPTAALEVVFPHTNFKEREATMKLCWVVRLIRSVRPAGPPMQIFIDASDGEIVGGVS